jgi:hypothetical protein
MKNTTQKFLNFKKKQAGVSTIIIAVTIAVGALAVVGGLYAFKYIGSMKVTNNAGEISDLRSSSVGYATSHGGRYQGLTLAVACSKGFFPDGRCSGTGASTTVTNQWGGSVTLTVVNLTGANTGAQWGMPGYNNKNCIEEITGIWNHAARISVNGSGVKTTTSQQLDDNTIISACEASNDDATVAYTFGPN